MTTKMVKVSLRNIESYEAVIEVPEQWTDEQIAHEVYQEGQGWHSKLQVDDNEMIVTAVTNEPATSEPNFRINDVECVPVR